MDHLKSFGRSIAIPVQDEKQLADGLLKMEKYEFGLSRKKVLQLVGQFVKNTKIKTPFKNGISGEDWFLGFSKGKNLSKNKPQSVGITHLRLENTTTRIGNLDETSFCTDPSKTKAVGSKQLPCTGTVVAPVRFDKPPSQIFATEETSPAKQTQSSTNADPGPSRPSLIQQEAVTFEDLLLDTTKTNEPYVLNKRKVTRGAEMITAEEVKRTMVDEKTQTKKST
ncbi:hypothetical protein CBL_02961 [Carabus blaptoides fortunei]